MTYRMTYRMTERINNQNDRNTNNITVNETGGSGSHDHGFTGTESLISTMMPYEVVHIWERTA